MGTDYYSVTVRKTRGSTATLDVRAFYDDVGFYDDKGFALMALHEKLEDTGYDIDIFGRPHQDYERGLVQNRLLRQDVPIRGDKTSGLQAPCIALN